MDSVEDPTEILGPWSHIYLIGTPTGDELIVNKVIHQRLSGGIVSFSFQVSPRSPTPPLLVAMIVSMVTWCQTPRFSLAVMPGTIARAPGGRGWTNPRRAWSALGRLCFA